jgi:metal-dependent amidase/aminoacylase/carboxypeptidase family protein
MGRWRVPGLFVFVGAAPVGGDTAAAVPNHSPNFVVDQAALPFRMQTLLALTLGYMGGKRG